MRRTQPAGMDSFLCPSPRVFSKAGGYDRREPTLLDKKPSKRHFSLDEDFTDMYQDRSLTEAGHNASEDDKSTLAAILNADIFYIAIVDLPKATNFKPGQNNTLNENWDPSLLEQQYFLRFDETHFMTLRCLFRGTQLLTA